MKRKWIVSLAAVLCTVFLGVLCLPLPVSVFLGANPADFTVCEFHDRIYRTQTLTAEELTELTTLLEQARVRYGGKTDVFDDTGVFYLEADAGKSCALSYSKAGELYVDHTVLRPVGDTGRDLVAFLKNY